MENIGLGTGLSALAFWGFIAAVVVAGMWEGIRKREAQHETIRRIIESGQSMDTELMDKLLSLSGGDSRKLERDLKVSGWIVLFIAPGLVLMGYALSLSVAEELLVTMLGVAALVGCIGIGLLVAAKIAESTHHEDDHSSSNRH